MPTEKFQTEYSGSFMSKNFFNIMNGMYGNLLVLNRGSRQETQVWHFDGFFFEEFKDLTLVYNARKTLQGLPKLSKEVEARLREAAKKLDGVEICLCGEKEGTEIFYKKLVATSSYEGLRIQKGSGLALAVLGMWWSLENNFIEDPEKRAADGRYDRALQRKMDTYENWLQGYGNDALLGDFLAKRLSIAAKPEAVEDFDAQIKKYNLLPVEARENSWRECKKQCEKIVLASYTPKE